MHIFNSSADERSAATFDIITSASMDRFGSRSLLTICTSFADGTHHARIELFLEHEDSEVQYQAQKDFRPISEACNVTEETNASDLVGLRIPQHIITALTSRWAQIPFRSGCANDNGTSVYVMSCQDSGEELCKIGIAASPEKRLRQLSTGSPHSLRLEFARRAVNARQIEAGAHAFFAQWRKNGEWFAVPAIIAIERINMAIDEQVRSAA